MAEEEKSGWSNPKLLIPLVLIGIGSIVGIPMFLKYYSTQKQNKNTGDEALAAALASNPGGNASPIDKGRALAMIKAAQAIYNEVTKSKLYVSSSVCVGALNQAQTDDEMTALNTAYNGQVSNSQRSLKADVDGHVLGWGTSTSDIKFYSDII